MVNLNLIKQHELVVAEIEVDYLKVNLIIDNTLTEDTNDVGK